MPAVRARSPHALARRDVRRATFGILLAGLVAYAAATAFGAGTGAFAKVASPALLVCGALICLARVVAKPADRLAWSVIGAGLAAWAAGDIFWTLYLSHLEAPPHPSLSDAGWLALYPCTYAGILLLLRSRRQPLPAGLWLDGAIAALGASALVVALVLQPVLAGAVEGAAPSVATNLAYPVGDLLLLAVVVWAFAATGWQPDRKWLLLGAGAMASAAADTVYLATVTHGVYVDGGLNDVLWPVSSLLMGWAAWQPAHRGALRLPGRRIVLVPVVFALIAVALQAWDHFHRLSHLAAALSAATLCLAVLRMAVSFLANARTLVVSREHAVTDALTGLGNRRRLMEDLDVAIDDHEGDDVVLLGLFDLDGFKRYNDTFGHPAGDALLRRLGSQLQAAVEPVGRAYRMGGDEFCILLRGPEGGHEAFVDAAGAALRESGDGFSIAASLGSIRLTRDVTSTAEALQVADQRMYGHKLERSAGRSNDARDVLMRILHEREPELHEHITTVAELARAVGERLGFTAEEVGEVSRAAELHDIGKMAIPDTILSKPGPLNDDEWAFMHRHTLIGEAILSASPALVPVARIVRSSHERFDGGGYPDALVGTAIPIAARVVAVCDAYDAMTSDRSYRRGMSPQVALEELRRSSGRQFDPRVVDAFCAALDARATGEHAAVVATPGG